jgi:CRISPR type III-A-associated RAMP protein Csm5
MTNKNTISIHLEALTPVHIGSGEELQGNFEYLSFQEEAILAVIDSNKIMGIIGQDIENINRWVAAIDKGESILEAIPELKNISSEAIAKRIITIYDKAPNPEKNTVKEQTHLGNQEPTIPGSSLKGAIRTAVLTKLIRDKPAFANDFKNLKNYKRQFSDDEIKTEYLGKEVKFDRRRRENISKYSANKDVFRFLRVGDFYFEKKTTVVKNTIINLFNNGWGEKKKESAYWECIPQYATAIGTIQVPQDLLKRVQEERYLTNKDFNFQLFGKERLFKLINEHTLHLVNKEIEFWEAEDNPLAIGDYLSELQSLKQIIENNDKNSCVIRVGASNGWEFMTGGWVSGTDVYGDYLLEERTWSDLKRQLRKGKYSDDTIFPKTRKMIEGGMPLGFVKLSLSDGSPIKSEQKVVTRITKQEVKIELPKVVEIVEKPIEKVVEIVIKAPVENLDFNTLGDNTTLNAEIIKIGKPFCQVKLLLNNYPFETNVQMSGKKKVVLEIGQVVKVKIMTKTTEGEIKTVKYIK